MPASVHPRLRGFSDSALLTEAQRVLGAELVARAHGNVDTETALARQRQEIESQYVARLRARTTRRQGAA